MDNPLKKIFQEEIKKFIGFFDSDNSNKQSLGIDIGSSSIKVVQLKKKNGKAILETYGVLSLGPYSNMDLGVITNLQTEDIAKALIDVIKESNITTKSATVAIPSLSSLIFTISLPGQISEDQLPKIIPIEARKYIPIPIGEVTIDWFVIPKEEDSPKDNKIDSQNPKPSKMDILVVAIHNDTLLKYQNIIKKTDLNLDSFEMEVFSNIRSSLGRDLNPVLLIDFGASKTKVSIMEAGVVRVFHVVNRGSQDISRNIAQSLGVTFKEAEKLKREVGLDSKIDPRVESVVRLSIDYIFSDINNLVLSYEKKYNKNISKVVLVGGGSLLKGYLDLAKENFKVEVIYSNPFSKTEAPVFLGQTLENNGPEFSVAVGLALRQLL